jgi:hypothetical protein
MSKYDLAYERQLVEKIENMGLYYNGSLPSLNYDQYHFFNEISKVIYNVIIEYNGVAFSLSVGVDYKMNLINNERFSLTYEEMFAELEKFVYEHRLVKSNG